MRVVRCKNNKDIVINVAHKNIIHFPYAVTIVMIILFHFYFRKVEDLNNNQLRFLIRQMETYLRTIFRGEVCEIKEIP